jgi:uncharacterized protein (DUF433 family)
VILINTCVFGSDAIRLGAKPSNKFFNLTYLGGTVLASATTAPPIKQIKTALGSKNSISGTPRAILKNMEACMDCALVRRDPDIMSGALCFSGTRVPVKNLFDYLEGSSSLDEFLEDFPTVSRERAVAVLEAAHERLTANASAA